MKIFVQTTGGYHPSYTDASGWHVDDLGRLHVTKTSHGNIATFHPGAWMFAERNEDTASAQSDIPEGYEPAEHSAAKNHAMDALEAELEKQGIDPYDEKREIDLIGLADAVVEALLAAGVTVPGSIRDPHAIR